VDGRFQNAKGSKISSESNGCGIIVDANEIESDRMINNMGKSIDWCWSVMAKAW